MQSPDRVFSKSLYLNDHFLIRQDEGYQKFQKKISSIDRGNSSWAIDFYGFDCKEGKATNASLWNDYGCSLCRP